MDVIKSLKIDTLNIFTKNCIFMYMYSSKKPDFEAMTKQMLDLEFEQPEKEYIDPQGISTQSNADDDERYRNNTCNMSGTISNCSGTPPPGYFIISVLDIQLNGSSAAKRVANIHNHVICISRLFEIFELNIYNNVDEMQ